MDLGSDGPISWLEAAAQAVAMGGHLATITSYFEQGCVENVAGLVPVWIGLNATIVPTDSAVDEASGSGSGSMSGSSEMDYTDPAAAAAPPPPPLPDWVWFTGEVFEYSNWAPDDPRVVGAFTEVAINSVGAHPIGSWHTCVNSTGECAAVSAFVVEYEKLWEDLDWIWTADSSADDAVFCRYLNPVPEVGPTTAAESIPVFVDEGGPSGEYVLRLLSEPLENVTVRLIGDRHISLQPESIVVTPLTWEQDYLVQVTGVADQMQDDLHHSLITHNISSADRFYDGLSIGSVRVEIVDDGVYTAALWVLPANYPGCTDNSSFNYDTAATVDDGTHCIAVEVGCMDAAAIDYDGTTNCWPANSCGTASPGDHPPNTPGNCTAILQGCTEPAAYNFEVAANRNNDGLNKCVYNPCLVANASNCSADATCVFIGGPLVGTALVHHRPAVNCTCLPDYIGNGSSCELRVYGCVTPDAFNYNPAANIEVNGSCIARVFGCINTTAVNRSGVVEAYMLNFDYLANTDDGNCIPKVFGCMNETALDYNPEANVQDRECQDAYIADVWVWTGSFADEVSWTLYDSEGTLVLAREAPAGYVSEENYTYTMPISSGLYYFVATGIGYGWSGTQITVSQRDDSVVWQEIPTDDWTYESIYNFTVPCYHHQHCERFYTGRYCSWNNTCDVCAECFAQRDSYDGLGWDGCPEKCWGKTRWGCLDQTQFNYDPIANVDNNTCIPKFYGCIDPDALNYDPASNTEDGSCIRVVYGCNDALTADGYPSFNFDPLANVNDGSCIPRVGGCIDPVASNFNVSNTSLLLSRGRPANSSSVFTAATAPGNAVDGDYGRNWPNLFQAGGLGDDQWWFVHLAFRTTSPTVRMWMQDCCTMNFDYTLHVSIGDTDDILQSRPCATVRNLDPMDTVTVQCSGDGEYIFVTGTGWISLPEVEVHGKPHHPPNVDDGSCAAPVHCDAPAPNASDFCSANATCGNLTAEHLGGHVCLCYPGFTGTGRPFVNATANSTASNGSLASSGSESSSGSDSSSWSGSGCGGSGSGSGSDSGSCSGSWAPPVDESCRLGPWPAFVVHDCAVEVLGCVDTCAINFNSTANSDDGSCVFCAASDKFCYVNRQVYGCTDKYAANYDKYSTRDDGSCIPLYWGCTDVFAHNFQSWATLDDGSCLDPCAVNATGFPSVPCADPHALCNNTATGLYGCYCPFEAASYNQTAQTGAGFVRSWGEEGAHDLLCEPVRVGCMNSDAFNFDDLANTVDEAVGLNNSWCAPQPPTQLPTQSPPTHNLAAATH